MLKRLMILFVILAAVFFLWYFLQGRAPAPEQTAPVAIEAKTERPTRKISVPQKICLNMIVKNESKVIKRCLDSVIPLIDYWIIVDTGSNDGTQKIIKEHLKGIPGELHERPWKNFAHNRNEALKLAQNHASGSNDYILFMDADDVLEIDPDVESLFLTKDLYNMWRGVKGFTYTKPQIARAELPWKWVGVTHEYLGCDQPYNEEILEKIKYITICDGASSEDKRKFWRNIELLEAGLKEEPDNHRYVFYLAESYRDAGEQGKAVQWYQKAVKMNGWHEEVFWSKLQIAHHLRYMGLPANTVIESYKDTHQFRPHRIEPVYYLAEIYNQLGEHQKAYDVIKSRELISKPANKDWLFNEDWIEEYGLLFEFSICSYYVGKYQESLDACDQILSIKDLPERIRNQTKINRSFPLQKLQTPDEVVVETKPKKRFWFF